MPALAFRADADPPYAVPSYLAPRYRVGFEAKVLVSVAQILNAAAGWLGLFRKLLRVSCNQR